MLAVEVVLAGTDPVPTFVFDEVDAGVGGKAAVEVGRRLAALARARPGRSSSPTCRRWPRSPTGTSWSRRPSDGAVTRSGVLALDEAGRRARAVPDAGRPGGVRHRRGARPRAARRRAGASRRRADRRTGPIGRPGCSRPYTPVPSHQSHPSHGSIASMRLATLRRTRHEPPLPGLHGTARVEPPGRRPGAPGQARRHRGDRPPRPGRCERPGCSSTPGWPPSSTPRRASAGATPTSGPSCWSQCRRRAARRGRPRGDAAWSTTATGCVSTATRSTSATSRSAAATLLDRRVGRGGDGRSPRRAGRPAAGVRPRHHRAPAPRARPAAATARASPGPRTGHRGPPGRGRDPGHGRRAPSCAPSAAWLRATSRCWSGRRGRRRAAGRRPPARTWWWETRG